MLWWHWLVLGLVLVCLELAAAGGFYFIFFGAAALLVALLSLVHLAGPLWLQLILFSLLSIVSLVLFRDPIMRLLYAAEPQSDIDTLIGETGVASEDIAVGQVGRVELRGTVWSARNSGDTLLGRGRRCVVVSRQQLMLLVRPEEV